MHKYLKKLIDQGWITDKWRLVDYYNSPNNIRRKRHKFYVKAKSGIQNQIKKHTSFLPEDFSFSYRLKVLRGDFKPKELLCPVCKNWRKSWNGGKRENFFNLTCGLINKEHKEFIKNSRNSGRIKFSQKNYKTDYPAQSLKFKKNSCAFSHLNLENFSKLSKEYIEENLMLPGGYINHSLFCSFLNCAHATPYNLCQSFGVDYKKLGGTSHKEEELDRFIRSVMTDITISRNTRSIIKKELDLYLPDQKLAIEYNGALWHSHGIDKWDPINNPTPIPDKHLNKTKMCQEKDIDLIHIFEDKYINKRDEIELLLKRKLSVEPWPKFTDEEIHWNLNYGNLPEQLQNDYKVIKTIPPRANYFHANKSFKVSKWTQYKTEEELYSAGYRKYYDCGELILRKINDTIRTETDH